MAKNKMIYALFLGLFLMQEETPKFVREYVEKNEFSTKNPDLWQVFTMLKNGDKNNPVLKSIILSTIQ